jgi:predicted helicase
MNHLKHDNLGLCIGRQWSVIGSEKYDIFFITNKIVDFNLFRRGGELVFPLYLYSGDGIKKPNINPDFLKCIKEQYQIIPKPEDILYYIYALLHSNNYRSKFEDFLKNDFPKIPIVGDYNNFKKLSTIGKKLVNLHLMKEKLSTNIRFDFPGSRKVEFIKYKDDKIHINKDQFFDNVSDDAWNFNIGGYQILDKWLKSRKNTKLSSDEIEHFIQVIGVIDKTMSYTNKIDEINIF